MTLHHLSSVCSAVFVLFVLHAAEALFLSFIRPMYTTNKSLKLSGMRRLVNASSSSVDKKNSFMVNIRNTVLSLHKTSVCNFYYI